MVDSEDKMAICEALPPRVKDVLRGFAKYQRPKEIAQELHLSVNTVRGYEKMAREKLRVGSTRAAALLLLDYEAKAFTPNSWGHQNQRVALDPAEGAGLEAGFPKSPELDLSIAAVGGPAASVQTPTGSRIEFPAPPDRADRPQGSEMALSGGRQGGERLDAGRAGGGLRAHNWLARLDRVRWLILAVGLVLGVIAAFGLSALLLFGILEILQQVGGPHR